MNNRINKPRVFLSHASKDKPFIERIAADLRRCHIEYWLDKEQIRVGRSWLKVIFQDGLPTCDAVFVYLTEDALRSKMVEKELDVASVQQLEQRGVALLPYVSNPSVRRQLRRDLQALQCKEWNEENYDEMLPEVVAEIWHSYLERTVSEKLHEDLDELKLENSKLLEVPDELKLENSKLLEVLDELKLENSKLLEEVESLKAKNDRPRRSSNSLSKLVYLRRTTIEDLAQRELFRNVNVTELSKLLPSTRVCKLSANKMLWPTRNDVDYIYIVLSGYVAIWTQPQFDQQQQAFLGWRGPEQLIGEIKSMGLELSSVLIDARDTCEFLEMKSDILGFVADSNPQIHKNLASMLVKRNESERQRFLVSQLPRLEMRIARSLINLAEERCEKTQLNQPSFDIPGIITQSELAAYVGAQRESVNAALVRLREQGIISYSRKGGITILNPSQLKEVQKDSGNSRLRWRQHSTPRK